MSGVELERGAFVVSIDTELAWGLAHRHGSDGASVEEVHHFERERDVIGSILQVFERYEIAATWAIVGHLFLDRCERDVDGRVHPEVVRPTYPWLDGDWFDIDPCSSLDEAPFFYGRDIVEQIMACGATQEVASHGFSHMMIGDAGCTAEVFASELDACRDVAKDHDVELRSFVYPRNSIGYLECLGDAGFTNYRGLRPKLFPDASGWSRRISLLADRLYPLAGSAVRPEHTPGGLWNLPQTYMFAPATTRARLPVKLWCRKPLARMSQAVRERSLFHFWFHPYNVTAAPARAIAALDQICAAAARSRDKGKLDILTMGDLAARLTTTHAEAS